MLGKKSWLQSLKALTGSQSRPRKRRRPAAAPVSAEVLEGRQLLSGNPLQIVIDTPIAEVNRDGARRPGFDFLQVQQAQQTQQAQAITGINISVIDGFSLELGPGVLENLADQLLIGSPQTQPSVSTSTAVVTVNGTPYSIVSRDQRYVEISPINLFGSIGQPSLSVQQDPASSEAVAFGQSILADLESYFFVQSAKAGDAGQSNGMDSKLPAMVKLPIVGSLFSSTPNGLPAVSLIEQTDGGSGTAVTQPPVDQIVPVNSFRVGVDYSVDTSPANFPSVAGDNLFSNGIFDEEAVSYFLGGGPDDYDGSPDLNYFSSDSFAPINIAPEIVIGESVTFVGESVTLDVRPAINLDDASPQNGNPNVATAGMVPGNSNLADWSPLEVNLTGGDGDDMVTPSAETPAPKQDSQDARSIWVPGDFPEVEKFGASFYQPDEVLDPVLILDLLRQQRVPMNPPPPALNEIPDTKPSSLAPAIDGREGLDDRVGSTIYVAPSILRGERLQYSQDPFNSLEFQARALGLMGGNRTITTLPPAFYLNESSPTKPGEVDGPVADFLNLIRPYFTEDGEANRGNSSPGSLDAPADGDGSNNSSNQPGNPSANSRDDDSDDSTSFRNLSDLDAAPLQDGRKVSTGATFLGEIETPTVNSFVSIELNGSGPVEAAERAFGPNVNPQTLDLLFGNASGDVFDLTMGSGQTFDISNDQGDDAQAKQGTSVPRYTPYGPAYGPGFLPLPGDGSNPPLNGWTPGLPPRDGRGDSGNPMTPPKAAGGDQKQGDASSNPTTPADRSQDNASRPSDAATPNNPGNAPNGQPGEPSGATQRKPLWPKPRTKPADAANDASKPNAQAPTSEELQAMYGDLYTGYWSRRNLRHSALGHTLPRLRRSDADTRDAQESLQRHLDDEAEAWRKYRDAYDAWEKGSGSRDDLDDARDDWKQKFDALDAENRRHKPRSGYRGYGVPDSAEGPENPPPGAGWPNGYFVPEYPEESPQPRRHHRRAPRTQGGRR